MVKNTPPCALSLLHFPSWKPVLGILPETFFAHVGKSCECVRFCPHKGLSLQNAETGFPSRMGHTRDFQTVSPEALRPGPGVPTAHSYRESFQVPSLPQRLTSAAGSAGKKVSPEQVASPKTAYFCLIASNDRKFTPFLL